MALCKEIIVKKLAYKYGIINHTPKFPIVAVRSVVKGEDLFNCTRLDKQVKR